MEKPENFSLGPSQDVFNIFYASVSKSTLWVAQNTKIECVGINLTLYMDYEEYPWKY